MNRPSSSDDGPTVIRTGPTGGPNSVLNSDFAPSSTLWSDSLPEGLRLGEYEILSVIGEGGFGIVYLAYDHFLQRQVALKEYMPSTLAGRARTGLDVMVKAERHRDTFMAGLRSFVNEARLLAQFDHPALVKVYRFWEAHGTAYMVMPYCIGPTLKEALASHDGPPDEDWLRHHLLVPLLEALALLHKAQCLHRDIAPDNILLTEAGPLLLDFGAARQIIGDMSQTLTVVLKPGYAPIEQYGEVATLSQGAWTDLYALAGVVRYAITGKVPVAATSRIMQDTLVPLTQFAAGQYSDVFLSAIDTALAVKPADRPQQVAAFQALLEGRASPAAVPGSPVEVAAPQAITPVTAMRTGTLPKATPRPRPAPAEPGAQTGPRSWGPTTAPGPMRAGGEEHSGATTPSAPAALARSRLAVVSLLAGVVVLGVAGGWLFLRDQSASSSRPVEVPPATARPTTMPPAPQVVTTVIAPSAKASAVTPVTVPAAPSTPVAMPAPTAAPAPMARAVPTAAPSSPPMTVVPSVGRVATALPAEALGSIEATPKRAPPSSDRSARCSDILQKASLEPLSPAESAFLKSECR